MAPALENSMHNEGLVWSVSTWLTFNTFTVLLTFLLMERKIRGRAAKREIRTFSSVSPVREWLLLIQTVWVLQRVDVPCLLTLKCDCFHFKTWSSFYSFSWLVALLWGMDGMEYHELDIRKLSRSAFCLQVVGIVLLYIKWSAYTYNLVQTFSNKKLLMKMINK